MSFPGTETRSRLGTSPHDADYVKRATTRANPSVLIRGEKNFHAHDSMKPCYPTSPPPMRHHPIYSNNLQRSGPEQTNIDSAERLRKSLQTLRRRDRTYVTSSLNTREGLRNTTGCHERTVTTAGALVANLTDLCPMVKRNTGQGNINFNLYTEKWLGVSDIDRQMPIIGLKDEGQSQGYVRLSNYPRTLYYKFI